VCFSPVSPSKKFTKLNFALRRNKFARLADRIDNFEFATAETGDNDCYDLIGGGVDLT
jgi:hypothetical protein